MPSLNLDLDLEQHPKMRRLIRAIGDDAMLYVIRLWLYCAKFHAASGRLDGYVDSELHKLLQWTRTDLNLTDQLVKCGWLSASPRGYAVHDWKEHAGHIVAFKIRGKANALKRWQSLASSTATRIATRNAPTELTEQIKKNPEKRSVHPVDKSRPRIPGEDDWQPIGESITKIMGPR